MVNEVRQLYGAGVRFRCIIGMVAPLPAAAAARARGQRSPLRVESEINQSLIDAGAGYCVRRLPFRERPENPPARIPPRARRAPAGTAHTAHARDAHGGGPARAVRVAKITPRELRMNGLVSVENGAIAHAGRVVPTLRTPARALLPSASSLDAISARTAPTSQVGEHWESIKQSLLVSLLLVKFNRHRTKTSDASTYNEVASGGRQFTHLATSRNNLSCTLYHNLRGHS
ncbi:hypothetical protein EVAR_53560_1 [Eumeta japonica]|uniref:Uncharacterized protein n=1 Tax=Eumeta variegata TaxID=151549 RepID=A0A4C1YTC0_EUMVA|nr:hypothetical protein EVAR_53560_1 [Eumeta japonica]